MNHKTMCKIFDWLVIIFVICVVIIGVIKYIAPDDNQGPQGEQGEQGERGDEGYVGETGEKGIKGDKGAKGDTGAKGSLVVIEKEQKPHSINSNPLTNSQP